MTNKENEVPKNGGQIVKEMLNNKNINLSHFSYNHSSDEVHYRRNKRKIEGTDVSMICDPTNLNVKLQFQEMVDNGTYTINIPKVDCEGELRN